jgi:hypothetical protein
MLGGLCYMRPTRTSRLFPGSSVVEQPAVNRLVAGSNPARGANKINKLVASRVSKNTTEFDLGPHPGPQIANFVWSRRMGLRDAIRDWWDGHYIHDEPSSLVILPGIRHTHWSARACRAMIEYARDNYRWLIGTLIAAVTLR